MLIRLWEHIPMTFESKYNNYHKDINFKMLSAKWQPFCLHLNADSS